MDTLIAHVSGVVVTFFNVEHAIEMKAHGYKITNYMLIAQSEDLLKTILFIYKFHCNSFNHMNGACACIYWHTSTCPLCLSVSYLIK